MRKVIKALRRLLPYGPRGCAMLSLALVALARSADYLKQSAPGYTPTALREFAAIIPIWVWGVLWGVTGLFVLISAWRKQQGVALGMLAGMSMLWALIYTGTAIGRTFMPESGDEAGRAWLSALGFIAFFMIVVALARMVNPVKLRGLPDA